MLLIYGKTDPQSPFSHGKSSCVIILDGLQEYSRTTVKYYLIVIRDHGLFLHGSQSLLRMILSYLVSSMKACNQN